MIKLKQWEYDLLKNCEQVEDFNEQEKLQEYWVIGGMKEKGHFGGIHDLRETFANVFAECEIVSDDYDGFEECK